MKMNLDENTDKFDELQSIFMGGIIDSVKEHLDEANISDENSRDLLEKISFSIATIIDASRSIEYEGIEPKPILTFEEDGTLIYPGGSSWLHEYVFGTISEIYGE